MRYSALLQEMRAELRKVDSSSLSTVVSLKSSSIDAVSAEGRIASDGSDYQHRNLSGGSQGHAELDPRQHAQFESYPPLKRGM